MSFLHIQLAATGGANDGKVRKDQLQAMLDHVNYLCHHYYNFIYQPNGWFAILDTNKDGVLSFDEYAMVMKIGEKLMEGHDFAE